MKGVLMILGLISGVVLVTTAGNAVLLHGRRAGALLAMSNWVLVSGGAMLALGSLQPDLQLWGWAVATLGTVLRVLSDRRRMRGSPSDRRIMQ